MALSRNEYKEMVIPMRLWDSDDLDGICACLDGRYI